jgi:hypothetical protein
MAKYNAIYEGRLPHGLCNKVSSDNALAAHQKLDDLAVFINTIYKQVIDFFG